MVAPDSEMVSQSEVESALQLQPAGHHQNKNNNTGYASSSLGRQSSIYSLTLDEFQHTLCESGKNFGSMNMDEFLNSIWTAEENQAHTHGPPPADASNDVMMHNFVLGDHHHTNTSNNNNNVPVVDKCTTTAMHPGLALARQGSLTLPEPLCRKTVDEVWAEIHQQRSDGKFQNNQAASGSNAQRQVTFGEMTLEDFLVRAGVVREQQGFAPAPLPPSSHHQPQQYVTYQNSNNNPVAMGAPYVAPRSVTGLCGGGVGGGVGVPTPYQTLPQQPAPVTVYGGAMGNPCSAGVGYGHVQGGPVGLGSPMSPISPDGLCMNTQGADGGSHYGLEAAAGMRGGGRKRIIDGPVEKVVERRQRRMIKNRESAARSRARKQAYTVELEAELNQLKEENSNLKQTVCDLTAKLERKKNEEFQSLEEMKSKACTKAEKAAEKLRMVRRSTSCAAALLRAI
ncbi:unnamed protein product [Cuscuta epithymum]|uniref:BZIP domain-containing protein n=1 Tax=Cuscuta epithymum TaxID=186058 RepID=A0AAV0CR62_9ASTE|nr:unnamed protein product [Cuscuta epithymum]